MAKRRTNQYLTIDLLSLHDVTKIILQGSDKAADAWTTKFLVLYSVVPVRVKNHLLASFLYMSIKCRKVIGNNMYVWCCGLRNVVAIVRRVGRDGKGTGM